MYLKYKKRYWKKVTTCRFKINESEIIRKRATKGMWIKDNSGTLGYIVYIDLLPLTRYTLSLVGVPKCLFIMNYSVVLYIRNERSYIGRIAKAHLTFIV